MNAYFVLLHFMHGASSSCMLIYSFTNVKYPTAEGRFDYQWPIFFQRSCSLYYSESNSEVLLIHDTDLDAWVPFRVFNQKFMRNGQLLFAPFCMNRRLTVEEESKFIHRLLMLIHQRDLCDRIVQPAPTGFTQTYPVGSKRCQYGSYITSLAGKSDEQILAEFDAGYRKAAMHSARNGAIVSFGEASFDDFYALYVKTMSKTGIYTDGKDEFERIRRVYGPEAVEAGVVYDSLKRPLGAIFLLYSGYSAYCTHAGSGGKSSLYGAMKLLHFEAMKRMRDKQVLYYDLAGVRINCAHPELEGIFHFKKGFGGDLKAGYLWKTDIHPNISGIFETIQHLRGLDKYPFTDIIDEETTLRETPLRLI